MTVGEPPQTDDAGSEAAIAKLTTLYESGALDRATYEAAVAGIRARAFDQAGQQVDAQVNVNQMSGGQTFGSAGVVAAGDHSVIIVLADATAADFWRQFGPVASPPVDLQQATARYLAFLIERYRYLDFKGMGINDRVSLRLSLPDMYVPLKARVELPEGETWARELRLAGRRVSEEEAETMGERLSRPVPVVDLLLKNDGLVVLGDPGAGKTTFLKFLALRLALGEGEGLGLGRRLPVLLPLSAYANALAAGDAPLDRFLGQYYEDLGIDLPIVPLLKEALARGGALLLLDGLDEVRDPARRSLVLERVMTFCAFHRPQGNKFILTSRIVGYKEIRTTVEGLAECTLVDFDDEEIALFIERWTAAVERAAQGAAETAAIEAERERTELLAAVRRNPGVRNLASNPLLLTILALMKRQGVALPERRVQLYDQYIRTLVKHWNLGRGLDKRDAPEVDDIETVRVLAPLALWMHETSPGVGLVKQEALRRRLVAIYAGRGHAEPERAARQLLRDAREHAGLLVERGRGAFGFIHLTFQEYLAAVAVGQLGQSDLKPIVAELGRHVDDANWREVIVLAVSYLGIIQGRDEAAGDVLRLLIEAAPGEPGRAAVLAGAAVADAWPGGVTPRGRERVVQALLANINDRRVKARVRMETGDALADLGDPRPGVLTLEPDLIPIPAGSFLMGDEKVEITIEQPFAIARYPATIAQYRMFVDDDGYTIKWRHCWTDEGWRYKESGGWTESRYWDNSGFNRPNQPVVGVSWYEAVAYCCWLAEKTGKPYRLPTEAEWERAARHTDGREYPWNGPWSAERANGEETGLERPAAVGLFPDGNAECGAADMSGNVWEWCQTRWRDEKGKNYPTPYRPDDGREELSGSSEVVRVIRGGAYYAEASLRRCSFRIRRYPDFWLDGFGFRVAASPFLSTSDL